jgi:Protein of unknown function (DUF3300)
MNKRISPAVIGAFVGASLTILIVGLVVVGSGKMFRKQSAATAQPEAQSSPAIRDAKAETAAASPGPAPGEATPEELEELVSPIALYPDLLVARILVASTFPTQIVEAHRWLEENPNLKGEQFATAVNQQPWDPSVRSLSQFRDVVKTMNDSLAWTSELGEAYYNQPDDVMDAIQRLRNRAVKAGTLKDTAQQKIEVKASAAPALSEGGAPAEGGAPPQGGAEQQQIVVIEPAQPNTVYVPQYNPSAVYGAPVQAPAGYVAPAGYTGTEMVTTGLLSFGLGMGMMALINEGDDDWDCGWNGSGGNSVNYNKEVYSNRGNNYPTGAAQERQASRQGAAQERQASRQGAAQERQASRQGHQETRAAGRATPNAGGAGAMRPTARPYNAASAQPYRRANPGAGRPTFPKASSLPANAGLGGAYAGRPSAGPVGQGARPGGRGAGQSMPSNRQQNPAQLQGGFGANAPNRASQGGRGAGQGLPSNRQQNVAQLERGFGANAPNRASQGGRSGAFGGYGPGGAAQAAGNRGRSSLGGGGGGGGFGGRPGGGGGGGRRGGGGGRGRR